MNDPMIIVLAESDPVHRKLMADLLMEDPGIEVLPAADGLEALELVKKRKPDVLLTDLFLPELGGLNLARQSREAGMKGCILIQTVTDTLEVYSAAAQVGADEVIKKPVNPKSLLEQLQPLRYGLRGHYRDFLSRVDGGVAHLLGKDLTARCAERLALDPDISMKVIYIEAARENRTSYTCVEKNVRKYIHYIYEQNSGGDLEKLMPREGGQIPSNKKFLIDLVRAAKIPEKPNR